MPFSKTAKQAISDAYTETAITSDFLLTLVKDAKMTLILAI